MPLIRRRPHARPLVVSNNAVTLLHDGSECFPAMLSAIESAASEVLLEMYWFVSDQTGWRFANALIAKAQQGVTVRVIYDSLGSWEADRRMFETLRAAGCQVIEHNPVSPFRRRFRLGHLNRRDHRKILVVDGAVAFTGGVNLGDPWASVEDGGDGWRDDMIRVEGSAALQMRALFGHTWRRLEGPELPRRTLTPSSARGDGRVAVLANFYLDGRRTVRGEYLRRIRAAREHILIANSYFLPDRQIRRALVAAVSRGVNVKVLVPGRSDVLAIYYASRRLYPWLLAQGIQIWEWRRTVLHSKTAVIDKSWCTVGTYNLDHRSWRFNLEVNVAVEDAAVGERMHLRFLADLALAVRVDAREFSMRSLTERLIEHFCYFFRKLL